MGRSVRAASITGVKHAIVTSIDADLVTLISALSLFLLASSSVKGFGLTLSIGIACDILMLVLFKAPIVRLLAPRVIAKHPGFWGIKDCQDAALELKAFKEGVTAPASEGAGGAEDASGGAAAPAKRRGRFIRRDINFLGHRRVFLTVSAVLVVLCLFVVGVKGLDFGIEFVGGTSISFYGTGDVTTEEIRDAFDEAGEPDAVIQTTETDGEAGFLVRTTDTDVESAAATASAVAEALGLDTDSIEVTTISASWSQSVIKSMVIALIVSLVLIIVYIAIRFEYKMGLCAIVALLHDIILVVGVYALVGREMNPNTVAALLTILGYSLYDTVVVFHRINDNMKDESVRCTFMTMANHSINQVLLRTINTTLTSLIPVLAMLFFGGDTLTDFAFAMAIGLVCGSYSSIAVATPLYAMWKTREDRYAKLVQRYGDEVAVFEFAKVDSQVTLVEARKAAKAAKQAEKYAAKQAQRAQGAAQAQDGTSLEDAEAGAEPAAGEPTSAEAAPASAGKAGTSQSGDKQKKAASKGKSSKKRR